MRVTWVRLSRNAARRALGAAWVVSAVLALVQPVRAQVEPLRSAPGLAVGTVKVTPAGVVRAFGRIDFSFQVSGTVATRMQWPYDAAPPRGIPPRAGISVDLVLTDPDGRRFAQPAFYAEEFLDDIREGRDWHLPTGRFSWTARFSPNRAGTWKYRIVATDGSGTAESPEASFSVEPSTNHGFIRVAKADPRYFEFDDGTAFHGLGVNYSPFLDDPATKGWQAYRQLGESGINFVRVWASAVFGSAWPPLIGGRNQYIGYLPVTGLVPYRDANTGETTLALRLDREADGDTGWFDACRLQWVDDPESVKPRTFYRLRIEYHGEGILGPADATYPRYGLVAKLGEMTPHCDRPGTGTRVTDYGLDTNGWGAIEGSWFSGDRNFLPRLHLGLENVRSGVAHVRSVSLREVREGGVLGAEIISKPSMEHQLYVPEERALSLDRLVEAAARSGIFLKIVVMEKDDKIYKKMADDGGWATADDNATGFYGVGRRVNKTRWLQQVWWRYLQARWGYSPNVHSWELTNEGDPGSIRHYELADEFGKFMHCRVFGVNPGAGDGQRCALEHPNRHLVTTSTWHSFPADEFWFNARYPNVDYADLHAYVSTSWAPRAEREAMQWDSATYHLWHSASVSRVRPVKPVVRGEAGLDAPDKQSETILGLPRDTRGVWLHNYLWSTLDSGGLYELYWWTSHIWSSSFDHRWRYRAISRFLSDVPLNKGGYVDWGGKASHPSIRVVGQKNTATGSMHLWIQNRHHTWKNVVDGQRIEPVSCQIDVPGFRAGAAYSVEWWDTHQPGGWVTSVSQATADPQGRLSLAVEGLLSDAAVKVRPADAMPPQAPPAQDR